MAVAAKIDDTDPDQREKKHGRRDLTRRKASRIGRIETKRQEVLDSTGKAETGLTRKYASATKIDYLTPFLPGCSQRISSDVAKNSAP